MAVGFDTQQIGFIPAGSGGGGGGGGVPEFVDHDYVSSGAYETVLDLGDMPENAVWCLALTIVAGEIVGGTPAASLVQLRGTVARATFSPSVTSQPLTSGNMASDTGQVTASGNTILVQFRTTVVGAIKSRVRIDTFEVIDLS